MGREKNELINNYKKSLDQLVVAKNEAATKEYRLLLGQTMEAVKRRQPRPHSRRRRSNTLLMPLRIRTQVPTQLSSCLTKFSTSFPSRPGRIYESNRNFRHHSHWGWIHLLASVEHANQ